MELLGDDRVVAPPSSKRVTEERWARVGLMRPDLARFGGCGVASSNFRRVAASSCLSSSRSARSCLNSSSRGAEAPAPIAAAGGLCLWLPLVHRYCSQGCPFDVTVWDPCPSEGCVVADARVARPALCSPRWSSRWDKGDRTRGDTEGRLAPRARLVEGSATAWVLHNLNRTRTQNACVECGLALCC